MSDVGPNGERVPPECFRTIRIGLSAPDTSALSVNRRGALRSLSLLLSTQSPSAWHPVAGVAFWVDPSAPSTVPNPAATLLFKLLLVDISTGRYRATADAQMRAARLLASADGPQIHGACVLAGCDALGTRIPDPAAAATLTALPLAFRTWMRQRLQEATALAAVAHTLLGPGEELR
jgi:hypothetical protein